MNTKTVWLFFVLLIILSCKKEGQEIILEQELPKHLTSQHFEYYMSENDYVDTIFQEQYFNWLIDRISIDVNDKLIYYKFLDRGHLKQLTGKETNAWAEAGTNKFYTIWSKDNHECVHVVVVKYIGYPPAFFSEGIAVAHQAILKNSIFVPGWNGKDFHELAKNFYLNGNLPDIDRLLEEYRDYDDAITYPVSGSFVRYLIDNYGIDKLKAFINISQFNDKIDAIKTNFKNKYEIGIISMWDKWIDFVNNYN